MKKLTNSILGMLSIVAITFALFMNSLIAPSVAYAGRGGGGGEQVLQLSHKNDNNNDDDCPGNSCEPLPTQSQGCENSHPGSNPHCDDETVTPEPTEEPTQEITPTDVEPTFTSEPTETDEPDATQTDEATPTEEPTGEPTSTDHPTEVVTVEPTSTIHVTATGTLEPTSTIEPSFTSTVQPSETNTPGVAFTPTNTQANEPKATLTENTEPKATITISPSTAQPSTTPTFQLTFIRQGQESLPENICGPNYAMLSFDDLRWWILVLVISSVGSIFSGYRRYKTVKNGK